MNQLSMNSLACGISALEIRRLKILRALEHGDTVPGEDNKHLPDLLASLETALAEFRQLYEERLGDSGLYLSYGELTAIAAD